MQSWFARLLLTSTALAPVGMTYAWVALVQGNPCLGAMILLTSLLLVLICLLVLAHAKRNLPASDFKAVGIEAADHENTAFLLLYVMPLFTQKLNTLEWQFWVPTLAIFALITATGYNYHFNPLLGLLRWHFYKVQSPEGVTYILITKKQLRTAADTIRVGQLTEYMLLDLGGDK
jgi:hypothetical protein